jgi:hypothetical protein
VRCQSTGGGVARLMKVRLATLTATRRRSSRTSKAEPPNVQEWLDRVSDLFATQVKEIYENALV